MEELKSLPSSWSWTVIDDLGEVVSGSTPSTKEEANFGGDIPWLTPADLSNYNRKYIKNGKRNLTEKGLKSCSATLVPEGSILYSSRAPIGYTVIAANTISTNQGFKNLIPSKDIFNEYIYHYLKGNKDLAESFANGTTFKELSAKRFKKIPVPIPPFNEQIRIVSKIDELFSRLDSGVRALQEIQQQIKHYRQSLFNDLFSFKFDIYRKVTIGGILEPSKERFNPLDNKAAAYIGLADIESNTGRILNIGKSSETKSLKSVFHSDDLLYGKLRPYLNKVAVPNFYGVCSTDIIVFKSSDKINHNYLQYVLMSNKYVSYATNNMSGQRPRIKFDEMAKFIIPYPPLEVQNKIHSEYEKRLSIINNMVINTVQCKLQSELLKQLILQKAFDGHLVPQDPRDEPASALLERIKAKKGGKVID